MARMDRLAPRQHAALPKQDPFDKQAQSYEHSQTSPNIRGATPEMRWQRKPRCAVRRWFPFELRQVRQRE